MRRAEVGAALLMFLFACTGEIADPVLGAGDTARTPEGSGSGAHREEPPPGTAFEPPRDKLLLLPFDVRMNKLAAVVGVPFADPMFDELRAQRYELGDHDFAHGTAPDLAWTASRMTTWLRALRPICASDAMRARYPSLRDDLDAFVLAAYGRRATAADRSTYDAATDGAGLDADAEYRAMCLAMLSSTEFVAQ